jgi:hypothetical protein
MIGFDLIVFGGILLIVTVFGTLDLVARRRRRQAAHHKPQ